MIFKLYRVFKRFGGVLFCKYSILFLGEDSNLRKRIYISIYLCSFRETGLKRSKKKKKVISF